MALGCYVPVSLLPNVTRVVYREELGERIWAVRFGQCDLSYYTNCIHGGKNRKNTLTGHRKHIQEKSYGELIRVCSWK